ncbi:uncharacterized protein LOC134777770 [Penaeus indicus]|uniref:uncharacterized protein LOC134777770 n=1 Tax=Penaeus indicus TaxID=29960 RepID=UPI00300CEBFC
MAALSVSLWLTLSSTSFIFVLCSPSSSSFPSHFPPPAPSTDAWSFSYYNYYPSTTPAYAQPPTHAQPPAHAPLGPREPNDHPNDVSRHRSTPPAVPFGHEAFHHRALRISQDDPARYLHAHALGSWPAAQRPYALHHAEVVHDYAHVVHQAIERDRRQGEELRFHCVDASTSFFKCDSPARPRHAHGSHDAPRSYAAFVLGGPQRPFPPAPQLGSFPEAVVGFPSASGRGKIAGRIKTAEGIPAGRTAATAEELTAGKSSAAAAAEKAAADDREVSVAVRAEKRGRFYQKLKERNHSKIARKFRGRVKKARHGTLEPASVASHGRRSSGPPHRGFLKASYAPSCARDTNRSYCLLDESYPSAFIAEELALHYEFLKDLWRPSEMPGVHNSSYATPPAFTRSSRQGNTKQAKTKIKPTKSGREEEEEAEGKGKGRRWSSKKEAGEGWSCPTHQHRERLSMARNTRGKWRLIVNVDGNPSLRQTTSLEECASEETSCDLLPTLVTSRCVQKHVIHNLLSWAPEEGFYVDSYRLPSACVCYISRVDLHLLYTFVENWDIRH